MILLRFRRAEHRHHGVALELVDRAAVSQHDLRHRLQMPADDGCAVARGQPLREG